MADLNPDYLLEQFQLIEEYLRRARGIAGRSREDYLGDPYAVDASVRELIVLFETSHNVAKHLISREGWRVPASKAEAFEILANRASCRRIWSTPSGKPLDSATSPPTRPPSSATTSSTRSCKLT